jgi:hypothetical protein
MHIRRSSSSYARSWCSVNAILKKPYRVGNVKVEYEVTQFLKMLDEVYQIFGLEYTMALSTRPEGYLGELELWNKAEKGLEDALNKVGAAVPLELPVGESWRGLPALLSAGLHELANTLRALPSGLGSC